MTDTNTSALSVNEVGRRNALKRFGYGRCAAASAEASLQSEWELLLPDFNAPPRAASIQSLPPSVRQLAEEYVRQRREIDRLMHVCDESHARIASAGARPDLVEAYTVDRDRFENAVEAFSAQRVALAKAFNTA